MTMPVNSASISSRATAFTKAHFVQLLLMQIVAVAVPILTWLILPGIGKLLKNGALTALLSFDAVVLSIIILPAMMLGVNYCYMNMLRGQNATINDLFSRLVFGPRSILLAMFTSFRASLWNLPGLLVVLHGAAMSMGSLVSGPEIRFSGNQFTISASPQVTFGRFIMGVGGILALVMYVIALIRYCMAMPVLADKPEMGVLECFRKSKRIMQGRKLDYFKTIILYVLILFALCIVLVPMIFLSLRNSFLLYLIGIVAVAIAIVGAMVIQVATLLFYLECGGINAVPIVPEQPSGLASIFQSISFAPKGGMAPVARQQPAMPNPMAPHQPAQNPVAQAPVMPNPVAPNPVAPSPVPQNPVEPAPSTRRAHRRSQEDWQNPEPNPGAAPWPNPASAPAQPSWPNPGQPVWQPPVQNPGQPMWQNPGQPSWPTPGQNPEQPSWQNPGQNPNSYNRW